MQKKIIARAEIEDRLNFHANKALRRRMTPQTDPKEARREIASSPSTADIFEGRWGTAITQLLLLQHHSTLVRSAACEDKGGLQPTIAYYSLPFTCK